MNDIKQKFYSCENILKEDANYNILLGERSNGKSYAIKEYCVRESYDYGNKFIYLRRYQMDVKNKMVTGYFVDCPIKSITHGKYNAIECYQGSIYSGNYDENGKFIKGKELGKVMYLSGNEHFKSQAYPNYTNIIYEEFVTKSLYLDDEPNILQELVSTVARRRKIKVWLIGNTINRINPYFNTWSLKNVPYQKQGTIENYFFDTMQTDENGNEIKIKISVEFCENSGNNSKMFFGAKEKSIASGSWESKNYPIFKPSENYEKLYQLLFAYNGFWFKIHLMIDVDTGGHFIFVYPTKEKDCRYDRIISNSFSTSPLISKKLDLSINAECQIKKCLDMEKVMYSDNLTAEDFQQCIKQKGEI